MADEVGLRDTELVEHARHIAGLGFLVIAAGGMRREPHPPQVRNDDHMVMRQRRGEGAPHVAGVAEAVRMTTAGPWPPTRTWIVAPSVSISSA